MTDHESPGAFHPLGERYADGDYLNKNPDWHANDASWKAAAVGTILDRHGVTFSHAAEVGAGSGAVIAALAERYAAANFVGYELSPQAFALCTQKSSGNLSFRENNIFEDDERFDLLFCLDVFEHVDDYVGFLKKLKGRAESFVFHIPLDLSASAMLRRAFLIFVCVSCSRDPRWMR